MAFWGIELTLERKNYMIIPQEDGQKQVLEKEEVCMKVLTVNEKGELSFAQVPKPVPGDYQALVRMKSCGVCNGTDTKLIHRNFKNFSAYPAILGHEGVGEVVERGSRVRSMSAGDLVLLPFLEEAVEGFTPGWGAYAEYALVGDAAAYEQDGLLVPSEGYFAQTVLKETDRVDPVSASMIITFREVLSAIRRFGFMPNQNVVVFGAGPVGLCFIRFSRLLGLGKIIAVDINDQKVEEALAMGADLAFNSTKTDVNREIRALFPDGVDYVVDAVGMNALINQAMELVCYNGKICCYGISPKLGMELDWSRAPYNWTLQFVQWPSKKEEAQAHSQVMAWINSGVLDPMDFISHVFPFEEALTPFEKIERRDPDVKKMVISFP